MTLPGADFQAAQFAGWRVIENVFLTVPGEPERKRRTWTERLFSRPWRPWVSTYLFIPQVPNPQVFMLNNRTVIAHPVTARALRDQLEQLNARR